MLIRKAQIPKVSKMKVEIIQTEDIAELDGLINTCIQDRMVSDIKLASNVLPNGNIRYTALIMIGK